MVNAMDKKKLNRLIKEHLPHTEPVSDEEQREIEKDLGLKPVTMRLQEDLVDDLKKLARKKGLKYQAYVRLILTEHVSKEKKVG